MMGRSHLIGGSAIAAASLSAVYALSQDVLPDSLSAVSVWSQALLDWLVPVQGAVSLSVYLVISCLLFWLGCLLPDIDSKTSMIGRLFPGFPGPHRGVMNTYWVVALLVLCALPEPVRAAVFLAFGYWTHIELDGLSRAGSVRFYPLSRHKIIRQGSGESAQRCVVVHGYKRGYRSGKTSEYVALSVVVLCCTAITVLSWWALL